MKTGNHRALRACTTRRALGCSGAWLLGISLSLVACAEPAPVAQTADSAATGTSMPARARPAPTPALAAATTTAATPTASGTHGGHALAATPAAAAAAKGSTPTKAASAKVDPSLPRVQVHKSPTCGCCSLWVEHMREAGFAVEVHDTHELAAVKSRLGVPPDAQSCHTAEVGGLIVEGHVPAHDIKRALAQGGTRALVLPGMPVNSPGMEVPGINAPPYTVERITTDGTREPFATHGE